VYGLVYKFFALLLVRIINYLLDWISIDHLRSDIYGLITLDYITSDDVRLCMRDAGQVRSDSVYFE